RDRRHDRGRPARGDLPRRGRGRARSRRTGCEGAEPRAGLPRPHHGRRARERGRRRGRGGRFGGGGRGRRDRGRRGGRRRRERGERRVGEVGEGGVAMQTMLTIAGRQFRSYFNGPAAYLVAIVGLAFSGAVFWI